MMFGLGMEDVVPQIDTIISVGAFYEKAAGGQIILTEAERPQAAGVRARCLARTRSDKRLLGVCVLIRCWR
jgi:hypothetical protein